MFTFTFSLGRVLADELVEHLLGVLLRRFRDVLHHGQRRIVYSELRQQVRHTEINRESFVLF